MTDRLASHRVRITGYYFLFGLTTAYDICSQDAAKASYTNDYADVETGTNRYEMARISSSNLKYMDKDQFLNEVSQFAFRLFIGDIPNVVSTCILMESCCRLKASRTSCNDSMTMSL